MSFGLKDTDLEYIISAIKKIPQIKKAVIFGSRAKGTNKNGSDVDLAIFGEDITFDIVARLHYSLEEQSPMPYMFDIVDYTHLENQPLKEHIDRMGQTIFENRNLLERINAVYEVPDPDKDEYITVLKKCRNKHESIDEG